MAMKSFGPIEESFGISPISSPWPARRSLVRRGPPRAPTTRVTPRNAGRPGSCYAASRADRWSAVTPRNAGIPLGARPVRTIAFLNKKGGVGKTSTCHHLAGTLGRRGLRILLVDADPQASLTQGLLGPEAARRLKPRETIAGLFDDACDVDMASLVRPAGVAGVSLVAGSGRMDKFNALEPWTTGDSQYILRDAL